MPIKILNSKILNFKQSSGQQPTMAPAALANLLGNTPLPSASTQQQILSQLLSQAQNPLTASQIQQIIALIANQTSNQAPTNLVVTNGFIQSLSNNGPLSSILLAALSVLGVVAVNDLIPELIRAKEVTPEVQQIIDLLLDSKPHSSTKIKELQQKSLERLENWQKVDTNLELVQQFIRFHGDEERRLKFIENVDRARMMKAAQLAAELLQINLEDIDGNTEPKDLINVSGADKQWTEKERAMFIINILLKNKERTIALNTIGKTKADFEKIKAIVALLHKNGLFSNTEEAKKYTQSFAQNEINLLDIPSDETLRWLYHAPAWTGNTARKGDRGGASNVRLRGNDITGAGRLFKVKEPQTLGSMAEVLGISGGDISSPLHLMFDVYGIGAAGKRALECYVPNAVLVAEQQGLQEFLEEIGLAEQVANTGFRISEMKGWSRFDVEIKKEANKLLLGDQKYQDLLNRLKAGPDYSPISSNDPKAAAKQRQSILSNWKQEIKKEISVDSFPDIWFHKWVNTIGEAMKAAESGESPERIKAFLQERVRGINQHDLEILKLDYDVPVITENKDGSKSLEIAKNPERIIKVKKEYERIMADIHEAGPAPKEFLDCICSDSFVANKENLFKYLYEPSMRQLMASLTYHFNSENFGNVLTPGEEHLIEHEKIKYLNQLKGFEEKIYANPAWSRKLAALGKTHLYKIVSPTITVNKDIPDDQCVLVLVNNNTQMKLTDDASGVKGVRGVEVIDSANTNYLENPLFPLDKADSFPSLLDLLRLYEMGGDSDGTDKESMAIKLADRLFAMAHVNRQMIVDESLINKIIDVLDVNHQSNNKRREATKIMDLSWAEKLQENNLEENYFEQKLDKHLSVNPIRYRSNEDGSYEIVGEGPWKGKKFNNKEALEKEIRPLVEGVLHKKAIYTDDVAMKHALEFIVNAEAHGIDLNELHKFVNNPNFLREPFLDKIVPHRNDYQLSLGPETILNPEKWQGEHSKGKNPYNPWNQFKLKLPIYYIRGLWAGGILATLGAGLLAAIGIKNSFTKKDPALVDGENKELSLNSSTSQSNDDNQDLSNLALHATHAGFFTLNASFLVKNLLCTPSPSPLSVGGSIMNMIVPFLPQSFQVPGIAAGIGLNMGGWTWTQTMNDQANADMPPTREEAKKLLDKLKYTDNYLDEKYKGLGHFYRGATASEDRQNYDKTLLKLLYKKDGERRSWMPVAVASSIASIGQIGSMGKKLLDPNFFHDMVMVREELKNPVMGVKNKLPLGRSYLLALGAIAPVVILAASAIIEFFDTSDDLPKDTNQKSDIANFDFNNILQPNTSSNSPASSSQSQIAQQSLSKANPYRDLMIGGDLCAIIPSLAIAEWGKVVYRNGFAVKPLSTVVGTKEQIEANYRTSGRLMTYGGYAALATVIMASISTAFPQLIPQNIGNVLNNSFIALQGLIGIGQANFFRFSEFTESINAASQSAPKVTFADHVKFIVEAENKGWNKSYAHFPTFEGIETRRSQAKVK